ncbi:aconitase [Cladochytrium replicatum]|nr:aconitase [Cladochytrium replicatum]
MRRSYATIASRAANAAALNPRVLPNYEKLVANLKKVRSALGRPLSLAEKILYSHQHDPSSLPKRGESYLKLSPDRVAMQDASAQMALLQFMLADKPNSAVPASVHCDHLIEAYAGGDSDVETAKVTNKEVFDFLENTTAKYGLDFWRPGSGIIHQIVLENYSAPGALILGTDSHTPNAGGLGAIAIGVGGADAVDAMVGIPWELKAPRIIGVRLTGKLQGWAAPKDVILKIAGLLTVRGGTNSILEYFGPGVESLSCTGLATICNMGAEVGATTSVFPLTASMLRYLRATRRPHVADAAEKAAAAGYLAADEQHDRLYDEVIEIDLSQLEPHLNGPMTPDAATPISQFKSLVEKNGWKDEVKVGLIGSCTNSSYQDMSRAASIAQQALDRGLKPKANLFVTPGSEQIRATIARDGQSGVLEKAGAQVLANACGPCIGMWKRKDLDYNEENAIVSSYNRNFKGRNDGFTKTMNFLASPELVTAMAFSGKLSFNPITDTLLDASGKSFKFTPPSGDDLPSQGFDAGREVYQPPAFQVPDPSRKVEIDPKSQRLQLLEPFDKWDGEDFKDVRVLVKVAGKCTTDHISAAGPWLKYKGHLENIANNTLIGATNSFNGKVNVVKNELDGTEGSVPDVAKSYKQNGVPWMVVADFNYGEGSAREHAALQPRYLGCNLILSRSFARIHETNLKKQGILPLTFVDPADYEKITEGCTITTRGVKGIKPGSKIELLVQPVDKSQPNFVVPVAHTMSEDQIQFFVHGSALNFIRVSASQS